MIEWVDITLLVVILLSLVIGVIRGLVKEVMSLLGWVLAGWVAFRYSSGFSEFLANFAVHEGARFALAFIILFLGVLFTSMLVNHLVAKAVQLSGLKGIDRVLGALFGTLRGGVIVLVLVLLGGITPLAADPAWDGSYLVDYFGQAAEWLSENFSDRVDGSVEGQQVEF